MGDFELLDQKHLSSKRPQNYSWICSPSHVPLCRSFCFPPSATALRRCTTSFTKKLRVKWHICLMTYLCLVLKAFQASALDVFTPRSSSSFPSTVQNVANVRICQTGSEFWSSLMFPASSNVSRGTSHCAQRWKSEFRERSASVTSSPTRKTVCNANRNHLAPLQTTTHWPGHRAPTSSTSCPAILCGVLRSLHAWRSAELLCIGMLLPCASICRQYSCNCVGLACDAGSHRPSISALPTTRNKTSYASPSCTRRLRRWPTTSSDWAGHGSSGGWNSQCFEHLRFLKAGCPLQQWASHLQTRRILYLCVQLHVAIQNSDFAWHSGQLRRSGQFLQHEIRIPLRSFLQQRLHLLPIVASELPAWKSTTT